VVATARALPVGAHTVDAGALMRDATTARVVMR